MAQLNLKKTDSPQIPGSGKVGIFIDSTNSPILILEDGTEIPLGGTTLEQIYIDAITGGQSPSAENPFVTLEQLNSQVSGGINTVLFGGTVQWSGTGLVFDAVYSGYIIEGVYYEAAEDTLTLTAADATNDRRDRFKLTTSGWDFNTGTPASVPVAPSVNSITEIDRGDVLIEALATTPTVTDEDVYLENTEWTTSSGGTGTFNADSTADPFAGTKAFEATNIQNGGFMQFTSSVDYDVADIDNLGLRIKLKASMNNGRNIRAQFFDNSDNPVSQSIALPFVKSDSTGYQLAALNKTELGFTTSTVRKLRLTYLGTGGPATFSGFFIDNVILEGGISQGFDPTFTQGEIDAVKNSNAPSASNPFATIADISTVAYIPAVERESNTILFTQDHITGNAGARSGDILFDFTNLSILKLGASTRMLHSDASAFILDTTATVNVLFDSYDGAGDNAIYLMLVKLGATEADCVIDVTLTAIP